MMKINQLNKRLASLRKQTGKTNSECYPERATEQNIKAKISRSRISKKNEDLKKSIKISDADLAQEIGGIVYSPGVIIIKKQKKMDSIHGVYELSDSIKKSNLDSGLINKSFDNLLFCDTETTGLSTSAGVVIFLLGISSIVDDSIVTEQILLNGFSGESTMLNWFNSKLKPDSVLVSYNGKSFDVPLLASRFRIHNIASPLYTLHHIDLVHWIRRMYKNTWENCRLSNAEIHCLGFKRQNDIPGSEAPEIWRSLLKQGDLSRLSGLLNHHYLDIVSLIGLLDVVNLKLINNKLTDFDIYATANYFYNNSLGDKAKKLLEQREALLNEKGVYLLAKIYRREKNWGRAVELWKSLHQRNHNQATEDLAKYHEHVRKDYNQALLYANALAQRSKSNEIEYRIKRLQNKISKI